MRENPATSRKGIGHKRAGQALVAMALILPVVIALVIGCVQVALRYLELAQVEDALRQATRASAQTFHYPRFAESGAELVAARAVTTGRQALATNLEGVHGLLDSPAITAQSRVEWTVLPSGGTCFASVPAQRATFARPAVCAVLQPRLTPLLGWDEWTPRIYAAETLDQQES